MEANCHLKPTFICSICDHSVSSSRNLRRHLLSLHGVHCANEIDEPLKVAKKVYPCHYCNKSFATQKYRTKHSDVCKHTNKEITIYPHTCPKCNKCFKNARSIYSHSKICKGGNPLAAGSSIVADQVANTIHNTNNTNNIDTQNNIQNQTNNNNIIIVYNANEIDFKKDHIDQDAFIQRILEMIRPEVNRNIVLDYGREILNRPDNKCIQKHSLHDGHSSVHVGKNKWNTKLDKTIYPKLACNLANDLSEMVYSNRDKIPRQWFGRMIGFLDYMSDEGYINTENDEQKHRIEREFTMLVRELKLIIHDVTRRIQPPHPTP